MLLGKPIMSWLFDISDPDAGICFVILIGGYFFSAIRVVTSTVLYTQRKVNINVFLTCISLAVYVILNIILIPKWQSVGAALASAGVNLLSAILATGYFLLYCFLPKKKTA